MCAPTMNISLSMHNSFDVQNLYSVFITPKWYKLLGENCKIIFSFYRERKQEEEEDSSHKVP